MYRFLCILLLVSSIGRTQPPARDLRIESVAQKQALVIGNGNYPKWPLKNPGNDARAMDQALRESGFHSELVLNSNLRDMERAVDRFVALLRPGDIAVFFYAGHGIQLSGENYMVPVDFDAKDEADAKYVSYSVSRVQERIEQSGARLNVLILDACRNNPFRTSRAAGGGLAAMNTGRGTFIAFATGPGRVADDNPTGGNGLFTSHVVAALREPGLTLDEVFNRVRERVYTESGQQQLPWTVSSVIGQFRFRNDAPAVAAAKEVPMNPLVRAANLAPSGTAPSTEPARDPVPTAPADPSPLLNDADSAWSRGDTEHAMALMQQVLRDHPADRRALLMLANGQYQAGRFDLFEATALQAIRAGAEMRFSFLHHHTLTGGHPAELKLTAAALRFDPMSARDCNQKAFEQPLSTLVSAARTTDNRGQVFLSLKVRDAQQKIRTLDFADATSSVDSSSGLPILVPPKRAPRAMEALATLLNGLRR